jgi:hypothetical protein
METFCKNRWVYRTLANDPQYLFGGVNHSTNFVSPQDPSIHTQTVERMWRPFKDANRVRHGTAPQMVESYIAEGLWRLELKKD